MKIAVIGAGHVGTALGEGWRAHGHEVLYGVREPGKSSQIAQWTGPVREVVAASDLVVLATPWSAAIEIVRQVGDLRGRVLVDATNPIAPGFQLAVGHTTSGAEELQRVAVHARVVKAFNSVGFEVMQAPRFGEDAAAMLVASDDVEAAKTVARLADDLGFEGIALPQLARARVLEPLAMLWIALSRRPDFGRDFALGLRRNGQAAVIRTAATQRAITLYGSGNIGGSLARAWRRTGHAVRIAGRGEAAGDAAVVVLAVPAAAVADVVAHAGHLDGKIVIDCTNALGKGLVLAHGLTTSAAEQLQARVPRARVVKAFNQQGAETLAKPVFGDASTVSFIAGDDADARATTAALARDAGLEPVEAGALAGARYLEPLTVAWIAASAAVGTRDLGLVLLRRGR